MAIRFYRSSLNILKTNVPEGIRSGLFLYSFPGMALAISKLTSVKQLFLRETNLFLRLAAATACARLSGVLVAFP